MASSAKVALLALGAGLVATGTPHSCPAGTHPMVLKLLAPPLRSAGLLSRVAEGRRRGAMRSAVLTPREQLDEPSSVWNEFADEGAPQLRAYAGDTGALCSTAAQSGALGGDP